MRQGKNSNYWLVVTLFIFVLLPGLSFAVTQLDPTFGEEGVVVTKSALGNDEALAVVLQDGKTIVAGYRNDGFDKIFAVTRYSASGELDKEFGEFKDGFFTSNFEKSGDTEANSIALQNGNIIAVGVAKAAKDSTENDIVIVSLTADGILDKKFGNDGVVQIPVENGMATIGEVQIASDDIFVGGTIDPEGDEQSSYPFFAKLSSKGVVDETFGSNFLTSRESLNVSVVSVKSLVLLNGGKKILGGGSSVNDGATTAGLLRLNADGTVDIDYGTSGEVTPTLNGTDSVVNDILVEQDGNILMTGQVKVEGQQKAFVGKIDDNGSPVTDFGTAGVYLSNLPEENVANAIAIQKDGSILVVGYATVDGNKDILLLEVDSAAGALSTVKNASNQQSNKLAAEESTHITTDVAENDDIGHALTILPDGKVLAVGSAGTAGNGTDTDFAILRFVNIEAEADKNTGGASSGAPGITTAGYFIQTAPVTDSTRVSFVSGGLISAASSTPSTTVTQRGVTYGIKPNPVHNTAGDDTTTSDEASTTDNSSDSSTDETSNTTNTNDSGTGTTSSTETITGTTSTTDVSSGSTDSGGSIFPAGQPISNFIVRSGQTENGSGPGAYTSDITDITPGTRYYLRAYAVLSDGEVIYGNQIMVKTEDACFIATAAFGSPLHKHVKMLRNFRDQVMLPTEIGQQLVGIYYHYSPKLAEIVADNELLRSLARIALLPFVAMAFIVLKTTLVTKLVIVSLISGLALLTFNLHRKSQVISI